MCVCLCVLCAQVCDVGVCVCCVHRCVICVCVSVPCAHVCGVGVRVCDAGVCVCVCACRVPRCVVCVCVCRVSRCAMWVQHSYERVLVFVFCFLLCELITCIISYMLYVAVKEYA